MKLRHSIHAIVVAAIVVAGSLSATGPVLAELWSPSGNEILWSVQNRTLTSGENARVVETSFDDGVIMRVFISNDKTRLEVESPNWTLHIGERYRWKLVIGDRSFDVPFIALSRTTLDVLMDMDCLEEMIGADAGALSYGRRSWSFSLNGFALEMLDLSMQDIGDASDKPMTK